MLDAAQTLFLNCETNGSAFDCGDGRVVVETRQAYDFSGHCHPLFRVRIFRQVAGTTKTRNITASRTLPTDLRTMVSCLLAQGVRRNPFFWGLVYLKPLD